MKPTKFLSCFTPIFCVLTASAVHAADGTWTSTTGGNWTDNTKWLDTNADTLGDIADGSTSIANFTSDITGPTTVTLGANRTIGNIVFSDNGLADSAWTVAGSTLTLGDNGGAALTSTITTTTNATISSIIAGNDGLTKAGAGTLTLSGVNTYTGTTNINAGTLKLDLSARSGAIAVTSTYNVGSSGTLELRSGTNTGADTTLYQNTTYQGTGVIRKTGTGYLGLMHTGTSIQGFNGTFDVQEGILGFNNGTMGSGKATVSIANGARVDVRTGTLVIDALNGVAGSNVYVSHTAGGTLSLGNNNGTGAFAGTLTNGGSALTVIKNGTGTQTLSGANTYTGATTINGGVLNLTGSLTSAVTVNSGGALSGTGSTTGNITFNNGSAIVLNGGGAVQGANVTFAATTNVFVADAPTGSLVTRDVIRYTGATSPGVANLSAATNYRNGAYTDDTGNKKITLAYQAEGKTWNSSSGGIWDINGASSPWSGGSDGKFFWGDSVAFGDTASDQTVTLTGNLASSSITVTNSANTYTFSGAGSIVGAGGLTKNGAGTLIIANTGTNSYTGATNVNAGTLIFRAPSDANWTLPASAKTIASGATMRLEFQSAPTTFRTTHVGTIVVNSGATLDVNGVTNVIDRAVMNGNGSITGSGTITKTGSGYVGIFSTTSIKDFTGDIDIQAGCLASNGSDWGSSAGLMNVNVASGAFLDVRTGSMNINQLTGSGHVGSSYNTGSSLTVGNGNGSSAFSGVIENNLTGSSYNITTGGALNLVKNGTGTLTLSGAGNTYTGTTTINGGVLSVSTLANGGSASGIGQSGNAAANLVFGAPTATLRYTGSTDVTTNRGFTMSSGVGGGATIESSGTGALTFDNTVAIAYGTAGESRVLTLGGTGTAANTFAKTINNNGAGATSLVKAGSGSWTLSGTHGYTGTTTVTGGKLVVNGNISTSNLTTVNSGGTLGGNGTVGALTVLAGGTVTPGNSPGVLNINGDYTQAAGTLSLELNGTAAGTGHDQLNVTGSVTLGGILAATTSAYTPVNGDLLFILLNDGSDAITGTFSGLAHLSTFFVDSQEWRISYQANSTNSTFNTGGNDIALLAIPEPNVAALLGGMGMLALLRRRR